MPTMRFGQRRSPSTVALLFAAAACGPSGKTGTTLVPPPDPDPPAPLTGVPAKIETDTIDPMAGHDAAARSPLLDIMVAENQRWMKALADKEPQAFYIAYQIAERRLVTLEAESGSLLEDDDDKQRVLDIEARVGSPELDNRHPLRNDQLAFLAGLPRAARMPFGEDPVAVQNFLWLETDRRYREASSQLARVLTDRSVAAEREDPSPDFNAEKAEVFVEKPAELTYDRAAWIARLRECSKRALRGRATRGTCRVDFQITTTYFVNSEGSQLQMSFPSARLSVSVGVKADDGMPLSRFEQRFARSPAELPGDDEVDAMIDTVNRDLDALHQAPVVDPYNGPAILEGPAAAVFFHEVFGHRIEGHRQKEPTFGQTFSSKVGKPIMPAWITVYDDPTITRLNGLFLNGFYRFDDEGVRAQRATLVDQGALAGFIMGRNPIRGFQSSNGHGRHEAGLPTVSRQGNLVVEAARTVPDEQLEAMLIDEVKKQGKPYGMIFTDISGGFTNIDRFLPQAFKVLPILTYRLYPDGRRELVRGVDIVGTPLTALASIAAAGRTVQTFNGICGAESGWVPVSASAPALLLTQLEVERGFKATERPPVLDPPRGLRRGGGR